MAAAGVCSVSSRLVFLMGLVAAPVAPAGAGDKSRCELANLGDGVVQSVADGRTLRLADGREVRLAGLEVPASAKAALQALVASRDVTLARVGPEIDRYGRVSAAVILKPAPLAIENTVQYTLLAHGNAHLAAHVGEFGCATALRAAEHAARTAGLGLWQDPHYLTANAENPGAILAFRGHLALVEGKVLSVRESGATIYVNFGRRWSEDFTVTVPKRQEKSFAAVGLTLKNLAGHRVRVRGTIEERGGPWVEANAPEQIEVVGD